MPNTIERIRLLSNLNKITYLKRPLVLGLCYLFIALVSCTKKSISDKNTQIIVKDTLTLALLNEPSNLNPLFSETSAASEVSYFIQRELTMHDDRWELIPDLAEKVPSIENNSVRYLPTKNGQSKKIEVTWTIRQDATWEDGIPVTADDYIFAWTVHKDPRQEVINREPANLIESMRQGDTSKTLIVTWKEAYPFFNEFQVHYCLPKHILSPKYKDSNGQSRSIKNFEYNRHPLSNGPFKIKEWVPGQHIILDRNPYYKAETNIKTILIRFIRSQEAMKNALLNNEIDGTFPAGLMSSRLLKDIILKTGTDYQHLIAPSLVWVHMDMNLDDPILQDINVRQALLHSIDRYQLMNYMSDNYTLAHGYLPPRHWGFNRDVKKYPYSEQTANKILEQAGWKYKKRKKSHKLSNFRYKNGQKLQLTLTAVAGIKQIDDLEILLKNNLKKIGIELIIDNKDRSIFFSEVQRHRKFKQMTFSSWSMDPTSWGQTLWSSKMIPSPKNNWQGQNFPGWKNAEVTKLLSDISREIDPIKRKIKLKKAVKIWADELPTLPLFFRPKETILHRDLKNVSLTGTLTPLAWNAASWKWQVPQVNTMTP